MPIHTNIFTYIETYKHNMEETITEIKLVYLFMNIIILIKETNILNILDDHTNLMFETCK